MPIDFVSQKCCLADLAFGFMPLERTDESFLRYLWVPASLWPGAGGRGPQDLASHMGGGSVYDDDGPVVEGAWARGSTRKGQRRGGALEKGRKSDVAGGEEHDHRVS
jgi:hypothetical protein